MDALPAFAYALEMDSTSARRRAAAGIPFSHRVAVSPACFAVLAARTLVSVSHWDNSVRCTLLRGGVPLQTVVEHRDVVTCVHASADSQWVATGSADTTVMVWRALPLSAGNVRV